jgi:hypothetical protein
MGVIDGLLGKEWNGVLSKSVRLNKYFVNFVRCMEIIATFATDTMKSRL